MVFRDLFSVMLTHWRLLVWSPVLFCALRRSFSGDNGGDSAAGGDSYLTFYFHIVSFPFREIEKRKDAHFGTERTVLK